jgi:dihydrolipoamide dehydrogenase
MQAQESYSEAKATDFLFRQLGKAQAMGETDGLFRLVSGPGGRILGVHMIGAAATSMLGEASLAVSKGLTADDVASAIHAHPTLPEGIWEAALSAAGRPLHGV